jgi:hypothetical protein
MQSLKWILEKLGLVIKLAFANTRVAIEIAMVAALFIAGWLYNKKEAELAAAKAEYGTLAANLQNQITIRDNTIKILNRRKDGKVTTVTVYLPSEGGSTVTHSTVPAQGTVIVKPPPGTPIDLGNGTIVYIQDRGFTARPGFGLDFDGFKARPYLDMKLVYFKRYSAAVGGTTGGLGVTASRHLDDILFFHPQNVEFFVHYRVLRLGNGSAASIGIRSNF